MLNVKIERVIFICIFVVCFFVIGSFGTKYKLLNLPINKGLSAEQIIEKEFEDVVNDEKNYRYLIIDEFLFTAIKSKTGYWKLEVAVKNEKSGYIFSVPGIEIAPFLKYKVRSLPDIFWSEGKSIGATIIEYKANYAVIIGKWLDLDGISVYANGEELESLTKDPVYEDYWLYVTDDLSEELRINCIYKNKEYHIVDNEEIKALFMEET